MQRMRVEIHPTLTPVSAQTQKPLPLVFRRIRSNCELAVMYNVDPSSPNAQLAVG